MSISSDYDDYMQNLYYQQAAAMSQAQSRGMGGLMSGMHQHQPLYAYLNPPKNTVSPASTDLLLLTIEGETE